MSNDQVMGEAKRRAAYLMTHKSCSTCIHVRVVKLVQGQKEMECRYSPPVPAMVPQRHPISGQTVPALTSMFPPVSEDTWCSKHMRANETIPLAEAVLRFQANATGELLPAAEPAKGTFLGDLGPLWSETE